MATNLRSSSVQLFTVGVLIALISLSVRDLHMFITRSNLSTLMTNQDIFVQIHSFFGVLPTFPTPAASTGRPPPTESHANQVFVLMDISGESMISEDDGDKLLYQTAVETAHKIGSIQELRGDGGGRRGALILPHDVFVMLPNVLFLDVVEFMARDFFDVAANHFNGETPSKSCSILLSSKPPVETSLERGGRIDMFKLGEGAIPASFKVLHDPVRKIDSLAADFGDVAIGRVSPVDSGFWWIIQLRAYTKYTGDLTLSEISECQKGMRLILALCFSEGFDTFPTLLCADGCSMIDRRMGISAYMDTPEQSAAIMDLIAKHWEELGGEMPLKISYPAIKFHNFLGKVVIDILSRYMSSSSPIEQYY